MKFLNYLSTEIKVYGLHNFDTDRKLQRLSDEVIKKVPSLSFLGKRPHGARIGFKTNAREFTVKFEFETLSPDIGMSIYSCQSAIVYAGSHQNPRYLGLCHPQNYQTKVFETKINKGNTELEDILIWLPRNEILSNVNIGFPDDAVVQLPTPYKYQKPIVYYGSSITESGCAYSMNNGYHSIISQHLDVDFYNLGFSGNAKGELEIAEYINTIDMSIFVYDYDHNAPTVEHLDATHEAFFKEIRKQHPLLPVIMMTRPSIKYSESEKKRREVVLKTYNNAIASGDKNVYFLDGEQFYGTRDRHLCTADGVHPNDLGFYRMAECIEPLIKKILENSVENLILEPMSDFFAARIEGYDEHMIANVEGCREGYVKMASIIPSNAANLLDLGCGTGLELDEIFKLFPNISVTGIDLTESMLKKLKEKHPNKKLNLICGDYFSVNLDENIYDCCISFQTMHHFSQKKKIELYKKIYSTLTDDGIYIESDYMVENQDEEDRLFALNERLRESQNISKDAFYHFDTPCTIENQINMLTIAGFKNVEHIFRKGNTSILIAKKQ